MKHVLQAHRRYLRPSTLYPSLLQPVYSKYINNVQYEYSYMCIGRGWYAVNDVKTETLLSEITGTKAEFLIRLHHQIAAVRFNHW